MIEEVKKILDEEDCVCSQKCQLEIEENVKSRSEPESKDYPYRDFECPTGWCDCPSCRHLIEFLVDGSPICGYESKPDGLLTEVELHKEVMVIVLYYLELIKARPDNDYRNEMVSEITAKIASNKDAGIEEIFREIDSLITKWGRSARHYINVKKLEALKDKYKKEEK